MVENKIDVGARRLVDARVLQDQAFVVEGKAGRTGVGIRGDRQDHEPGGRHKTSIDQKLIRSVICVSRE